MEPDIIYDMDAFRRDFKMWMEGEKISVDIRDYGTKVEYVEPPTPPEPREYPFKPKPKMRPTYIDEGVSGHELIQQIKQSIISFFDWLDLTFIPERWYKEPEKFV